MLRTLQKGLLERMKNSYSYPAKISREKGEILLEFIDFPNLIVVSEQEEGVIEQAQEVLALEMIDMLDAGKEPPKPTVVMEGAIYIHVWLPYYRNMAKEVYIKKTVTIPQWLDILAKDRNVNFSACMVKGIKEELGIK